MKRTIVLLLLAGPVAAQWGRDIDAGMGRQLLSSVEDDLAAVVRAAPAGRAALLERVAERHAEQRIEALKRFRNPELFDLFVALLDHQSWMVQHRALLALEYYGDAGILELVWPLLEHPHRRVREKAAITITKLWKRGAAPLDLEALRRRERDLHVRRCLDALAARLDGRLHVERVHEEHRVRRPDGLLLTPYLDGTSKASAVAPDYVAKPVARTGKGGARKFGPVQTWTTPLLGFLEEEVPGVSLQPFAKPRGGGNVVHTGMDVGACLDGAGYYALAEGIVMLVHSGSDMGTLIVVEHRLLAKELVCAVYMHGGDTVFVKAGDRVESGQLLGSMGLGFSIENGGHFAHLHFGLYPGPFDLRHNYGYKAAEDGLSDWYDPAEVLPQWIERTVPLVEEPRGFGASLTRVVARIRRDDLGRAFAEAREVRDSGEPGGEAYVEAMSLMDAIRQAPRRSVERAVKWRDSGYPGEALRRLKQDAIACKGVPDAETIAETRREWEADALFQKALKGEGRIDSTTARARKLKDPARARALWEQLLETYGDTCLASRIQRLAAPD